MAEREVSTKSRIEARTSGRSVVGSAATTWRSNQSMASQHTSHPYGTDPLDDRCCQGQRSGNRRGLRAIAKSTGVVGTMTSDMEKCVWSRPEPTPLLSPMTL